MTVPPGAIELAAIQHVEYRGFTDPAAEDFAIAEDMLKAAAPLIAAEAVRELRASYENAGDQYRAEGAAAERDRWQPLVVRIREAALEGGQDARSVRMHIIAILDGADLLRGDRP